MGGNMERSTPIIPSLKGKRVLVTGGSAGIGKATALEFDANGATVAVLGRRLERLEAVVKEMKHGHAIVGDLTNSDDMKRAMAEAVEKMGGLDILINNGGVTTEEMHGNGEEAYLSAIKLHVTGNLTLIRAAEEELVKNKGAIVNVSSIAAIIPMPSFSSYSVAKAAQDAMTRGLALEFAPKGVRVNSVLPGAIATEVMEGQAAAKGITVDELLEKLAVNHAMQRCAGPEEVAAPIVFLASDAASFITGVNMCVDGGATLGYWFNKTNMFE